MGEKHSSDNPRSTQSYHSNSSFIFLPFRFDLSGRFDDRMILVNEVLTGQTGRSGCRWQILDDQIHYLLRFVTDKVVNPDPAKRKCFHYILKDSACKILCPDTRIRYGAHTRQNASGLSGMSAPQGASEHSGNSAGPDMSECSGKSSHPEDTWYCLTDFDPDRRENIDYYFQILSSDLFLFSTGVGIVTFQIWIDDRTADGGQQNTQWIADTLYHLKKVTKPVRYRGRSVSLLDLARQLTATVLDDPAAPQSEYDFFYFAHQEKNLNKRANIMSLVYQPDPMPADTPDAASGIVRNSDIFTPSVREDLYYLRHCYSQGYHYVRDVRQEDQELLSLTGDILWGVSSEAMTAIVYPEWYDGKDRHFLEHTFYRNFNIQYLFMYVFLLHQKFALYQFLTEMGSWEPGEDGSIPLSILEDYSRKLYQFETDFEYSRVTDVPQYQLLYEIQLEALGIPQLFTDVKEPLEALRRQKEQDEEKHRRKMEYERQQEQQAQSARENKLNQMLTMVGCLAIFSALVDSYDFISEFLSDLGLLPGLITGSEGILRSIIFIVQLVLILLIGYISLKVIREYRELRRIRKEEEHSDGTDQE